MLCNIYLGLLFEYLVRTEAALELLLPVAALLGLNHDKLGRVVLDLPDPGPGHGAGDPGASVISILGLHSLFIIYRPIIHPHGLILLNYLPASESVERILHPPGHEAGISPG